MATQGKIGTLKAKNFVLIGKCGKCGREFTAQAKLPTLKIEDEEGNTYLSKAAPHLVTLCPFCFGLLNLAKRVEVNKHGEK
ncbi:MAG: hypothetical protein QXQ47_06810 [Candidatus Bathyarchaeia archaeon]